MATHQQIQTDLIRGWDYFNYLSTQEAEKAESGFGCCGNKLWPCLFRIVNALQWRVDINLYDDTTDKLYSDMMEIVGDYSEGIGPIVDAGPDQIINQPASSTNLNGTVTPGDAPIVSTVWQQQSGPSQVIFGNPFDVDTTVSGMNNPGNYILRLTAMDSVGRSGSDPISITVQAVGVRVYYGFNLTGILPDQSTILNSDYVDAVLGADVIVPFENDGSPVYYWIAYVLTAPQKNNWQDTVQIFNYGIIGEPGGLFKAYETVNLYRVSITRYVTQILNPYRFF